MLDGLFGTELPFAVKFILAFVIVLGLILLALWAVRRFGSGGLDGVRGRQHRLSVLEWARVDNRRSLCLIRRDNVEHLLIVGGPTDVVIEANIVRAAAAPRDVGMARPPSLEPLPRAIPLPDNGNGSWPLQPEAPLPSRSAPKVETKIEPVADEPAWPPLQPQADTPPSPAPARPQRDTLAALADELSARPSPPLPPSPRGRPLGAPRLLEPRADRQSRSEPRPESRPEQRTPAPPAAAPVPADAAADADAAAAAAADQSLAEMAHRLEAALRKPGAPAADARTSAPPRPAPAAAASAAAEEQPAAASEPASPPPPSPPRGARPQNAEPKQPPRNNAPANNAPAKPPQSPTLYDNLEQEMASLLGRPTNKN